MTITIPEDSILIKTGLYCHEYTVTVGEITKTIWELFSEDGYCFYDLQQPENYDDEGTILPANQLVYARYMKMPANEQYVTNNIVSVPIQNDYSITD
jgi:hypothetical protein